MSHDSRGGYDPDKGAHSLEHVLALALMAIECGDQDQIQALVARFPQWRLELLELCESDQQFEDAAERARQEIACAPAVVSSDNEKEATTLSVEDSVFDLKKTRVFPFEFGDYTVLREIDRGGMGIVYRARQRSIQRDVALKLIRSGELASQEEIARFHSEAQAAANLRHPGIVPIYEVASHQGLVFFTMPYIDGEPLTRLCDKGPLDIPEAMRLAFHLCEAVAYAHNNGVIHRDIKPANILIDRETGKPVLIDFGLAKLAQKESSLTATGQLLGTPAYMAPEVASGSGLALQTQQDVYAIGAVLYFMCSGQPPFVGPTPFDVLLQVLDRTPPKLSTMNREVSQELDFICSKALSKRADERYQSVDELQIDLRKIMQGKSFPIPSQTIIKRLVGWWRREPILAVHSLGIGLTAFIVLASGFQRNFEDDRIPLRLFLFAVWFAVAFVLQRFVRRASTRDLACLSWAVLDVVMLTWLLCLSEPPKAMLMIGYPMLIVASALFYRHMFVVFMTSLCVAGTVFLTLYERAVTQIPAGTTDVKILGEFSRIDFSAIYLSGLVVLCVTLLAIIHRFRSMFRFCDEEPTHSQG